MHEKTGAPRVGAAQLVGRYCPRTPEKESHALYLNLSVIPKPVLLAISR